VEDTIIGAAALTVTESLTAPTSRRMSMTGFSPALRLNPWRTARLNPSAEALISYSPGARKGIE
jgi:hypothetical protein